jgi:hypothetical protein
VLEKQYDLWVRVEIREPAQSGSGLVVEEREQISCRTFLEVAQILGQFHELTEAIERSRKGGK